MANPTWVIKEQSIAPGQTKRIQMQVNKLASGTDINLDAFIFRSKVEGPTLLVMAGLHGDEINGIEILRRCLVQNVFTNLKKGSIIAIPILNIFGFINFSREVTDGKDVNRSFPGSSTGSLASRVAFTLTKDILKYVNAGLDFHTGGNGNYNHPQIRFTVGHNDSEALARAFAPPVILSYKPIAKSLRKTAIDMGIPMLVYEGGENLRLEKESISEGMDGIKRVMQTLGLKSFDIPARETKYFKKTKWLRAARPGLFLWEISSGNHVKKGQLLGFIHDPYGKDAYKIKAPYDGFIIGHTNTPVVNLGDALFHIAEDK